MEHTYHIASLQPKITVADLLADTPTNRVFVAVETDWQTAIDRAEEWSGYHPERPIVWVNSIVVADDGINIRVAHLGGHATPIRAGIRERIGKRPAPLIGENAIARHSVEESKRPGQPLGQFSQGRRCEAECGRLTQRNEQ